MASPPPTLTEQRPRSPAASPVVFLHGWGGSFAATYRANGWEPTGEADRIIRVDLPGHANLHAPTDPACYNDLAALVMDQLPDRPVSIVGYSLGAKIALEIASRQPAQVVRMALMGIGNNVFLREPSADAVIDALENGITPETAAAVADLVRHSRLSGSNAAALAALLRRSPNPVATRETLSRITASTLIANSDADRLAIPDGDLVAAIPSCSHVMIPGVVHSDLPASPEFKTACLDFVNDAMSAATPVTPSGEFR